MEVKRRPELHVVLDPDVVGDDVFASKLTAVGTALAEVPVRATAQLRIKTRVERIRFALARLSQLGGFEIAVNGAVFDGAGVHWPEAALPNVRVDRRASRVGASVHSVEALAAAAAAGADYVFFGPVFDPGSKPARGVGVEALAAVARSAPMPVIAIGGVTPDRVAECIRSGAAGVAALTTVLLAADPAAVIRSFSSRLEEVTRCRT